MVDLEKILEQEEGCKYKPYTDTVGKLTIGIGRNLTDKGLSRDEVLHLLRNDIKETAEKIQTALPWIKTLSESQQAALIDLGFNMGVGGLLGFKNMLSNLKAGNISGAIKELKSSKWWDQIGVERKRNIINLLSNKPVNIIESK